MKYTEKELADAIDACLYAIDNHCGHPILDPLLEKFPCLKEIWDHGPDGPCGVGLGKLGGHSP